LTAGDGPTLDSLGRILEDLKGRIQDVEEVLEGSVRWQRDGLIEDVKKLRAQQGEIHRLVEAIKQENRRDEEERAARDSRNSRYQQLILGGVVSLIVGILTLYAGGGI